MRQQAASTGTLVTPRLTIAVPVRTTHRFTYRGSSQMLGPGAVVVVEPGEIHVAEPHQAPYDVDVLFFEPSSISRLIGDDAGLLQPGLSPREPSSTDPNLLRAFFELAGTLRNAKAPSLLLEERAVAFVRAVQRAYARREAPPTLGVRDGAAVRRARDMICAHSAEAITLDELAAASGLTKLRLLRAFKRVMGVPPHAYQVGLRVDNARRLIASGVGLSEAATEAGFSDQSHLNRHFVRAMGVTPGAYARMRGH